MSSWSAVERPPSQGSPPQAHVEGHHHDNVRPSRVIQLWEKVLHDVADPASLDQIRASLFEHGSPRAAMRILVAAIVNHIRRILTPWLGQFLWHHALADMKLARSSPHHYLSDAAVFDWSAFVVWTCLAYALPKVRRTLRETAVHDHLGDGWIVLYLTAMLTGLEAAYVQTCWTFAQLYAYGMLFAGGPAEHDFLETFMADKSARITAQLGLVVEWAVHAVLPTIMKGLGGRWVLLVGHGLVWGGTAYVVRYSNKYFLALEMSDIFITFGWMACGMMFVGMDTFRQRVKGRRA